MFRVQQATRIAAQKRFPQHFENPMRARSHRPTRPSAKRADPQNGGALRRRIKAPAPIITSFTISRTCNNRRVIADRKEFRTLSKIKRTVFHSCKSRHHLPGHGSGAQKPNSNNRIEAAALKEAKPAKHHSRQNFVGFIRVDYGRLTMISKP